MYEEIIDRSELLFRMKLLKDRVDAFESGEKYLRMKEEHRKAREADHRYMKKLEKEAADANISAARVRDLWYQTCLDVMNECEKKLRAKDRECKEKLNEKNNEIARLKAKISRLEERNRLDHEKMDKALTEKYESQAALLEEQEKNAALMARINKDYSNSSKPSSQSPNHKKIHNGREKTGRKPGGQPGHVHHGRKRREPTSTISIPAPDEYVEDDNYKPTGRIIRKQLIRFRLIPEVLEFTTPEFRDQTTGQRVHAAFPEGITDDVNYDGTVKAIAYMINNELYTSVDKTRKFLDEISHGVLALSNGFICELSEEFSKKTEQERNDIFLELASSPLLHMDFTFGRMNGGQTTVAITSNENNVLFQGRTAKGDKGVKGTPLEFYDGTVVSDHESAIKKHGSRKQECMAHVRRYAKGASENEPDKTWGGLLAEWISGSVLFWNEVNDGIIKYDKRKADAYIQSLREIIKTAHEEYEYDPPNKYNREGYNTYKRIEEEFDEYVLFLRDPSVPPTNNICERFARVFKRKAGQVMAFRSQRGVDTFCDGLTITESLKARGENVFDALSERFNQGLETWGY